MTQSTPESAWSADTDAAPVVRTALIDLVSSYRRPALLTDARGQVVHMNEHAEALIAGDAPSPEELARWPHHRVQLQTEDGVFFLLVPEGAEPSREVTPRRIQLPPRLAKIARLVISGCTDKQIAARTGLSFSTVRTYVRQIYRRLGVHSRVELVHATGMGLTIG